MEPQEVLAEWGPFIHTVPHESTEGCCPVCYGTCGGYPTCFPCGWRWTPDPRFQGACDLIVPCTVAVSPSPWYTALRQYKSAGYWRRLAPPLMVTLWAWMNHHWPSVCAALGGEPTVVTVVPSTTQSMPTPLYRVVEAQPRLEPFLRSVVTFDGGRAPAGWRRRRLIPEAFAVDQGVEGERVLVIDDTWVTGTTALSASIALRAAGASRLALVPIARMVYKDAMSSEYEAAATTPVDFTQWPRHAA